MTAAILADNETLLGFTIVAGVMFLGFAANLYWAYLNWRARAEHQTNTLKEWANLAELREKAMSVLRDATTLATKAAADREHKVCDVCQRIVARHSTDAEGKTTCINCAAEARQKVPING